MKRTFPCPSLHADAGSLLLTLSLSFLVGCSGRRCRVAPSLDGTAWTVGVHCAQEGICQAQRLPKSSTKKKAEKTSNS